MNSSTFSQLIPEILSTVGRSVSPDSTTIPNVPSPPSEAQSNHGSGNDSSVESTWWTVIGILSGVMGPLFIIWLILKIFDIRRFGFHMDYFYEPVELLDPIEAKSINFLYNKAELGISYRPSKLGDSINENCKTIKKKKRFIGAKSTAASLIQKFNLPVRKKKAKNADGIENEELHPVKSPRKLPKPPYRKSTNLNFGGKVVQVELKTVDVGRSRPLPPLPPKDETSTSIS